MPEKLHAFSMKIKQIEFDPESFDSKAEMHVRDSVRQIKAIQRDMPDFSSLLANPVSFGNRAPVPMNLFTNELPSQAFPVAKDPIIKN